MASNNMELKQRFDALKAYGLEADDPVRQKHGVRIQTRLMAVE